MKHLTIFLMILFFAFLFGIIILTNQEFFYNDKDSCIQEDNYHFVPTTLQPSLYSEGEIKVYKDRIIIYAGQGDSFFLGHMVSSTSMKPAIPDNATIIYLTNFSKEDLHIGDVVGISRNIEEYGTNLDLVHRIVNISESDNEECYITKGDNNKNPDSTCWEFSEIKGIAIVTINIKL